MTMKRTFAMLMALAMMLGLLAGCAKEPADPTPDPDPTPAPAPDPAPGPATPDPKPADPTPVTPPAPAEPKIIKLLRSGEDTTLNTHDSNNTNNGDLVDDMVGKLYKYMPAPDGSKAELRPDLAAEAPVSTDGGITWTIKLNKDAVWPDGQKITADDWIYSFQMSLDPKLVYGTGAALASQYVTIAGAMDYYKQVADGKTVTWDAVGIQKVDDYTLEVKLTGSGTQIDVMRQFYARSAGLVRKDIYEKCISADGTTCDYGSSTEKVMFCGPYIIDSWTKGSEIMMKKNETYVHADMVKVDGVYSRVVADESTRMELFEKGECDYVTLGTNGMAKYEEDPRTRTYTGKTIYTMEVNHNQPEKPYLADPIFRKALFYAVDRAAIAKVTNNTPAPYFISSVGELLPDGTTYRDYSGAAAIVPANNGYDPDLANKYLDEAFKKYNLTSVNLLVLFNDSLEVHRVASEYLQSAFKNVFGGKVTLELQATPKSNLLATMRTSNKGPVTTWDLAWSGWALTAESFYPWKKAAAYGSTYGNRYTPYNNAALDALLAKADTDEYRLDPQKLADLTVEMEKAMYEDMTCIPVVQGQSYCMFSERMEPAMSVYVAATGWGTIFGTLK